MRPGRVLRKHILVADDEPSVRDALTMLLEIDHHRVTEAQDGVEALDLLAREKYDLLIMKGNELAAKVKELYPSQPILMITAYPERLEHCDNRVDAILHKPFAFEDLRRAIARLLS